MSEPTARKDRVDYVCRQSRKPMTRGRSSSIKQTGGVIVKGKLRRMAGAGECLKRLLGFER